MNTSYSQMQTGLLTNESSKKYQEPQKEIDIELQNMTDQQSYILFTNDQTYTQPKQQQHISNPTQPQSFGQNHQSSLQAQYLNQNQQQQFVLLNTPINNQYPCNKQKFGQKQNMIQNHYSVCIFCKTPQTITNDQGHFRCYQCGQVQKPIYEFLKCVHCKVNVKYQKGISSIIRCTKCNNHNFVSLQPLAQDIQEKQKI